VFRAARILVHTDCRSWPLARFVQRTTKAIRSAASCALAGETHVTVRELRAALVYILFGVHFCDDYHEEADVPIVPFWIGHFRQIHLIGRERCSRN